MVLKARETKRYEFEAINAEQASEIVHKIVRPLVTSELTLANADECVRQDVEVPGAEITS
jgi:hypothetical protein